MKAYIYKQGDETFIAPAEKANLCGTTYQEVGLRHFCEVCYEGNYSIYHVKKDGREETISFTFFLGYRSTNVKRIDTPWCDIHICDDGVVFVVSYRSDYEVVRRYPSYEDFKEVACPPVE